MKSKWLVFLLLVCIPCLVRAQATVSIAPDAASREDVKKLFDLMSSREQMRQTLQKVLAQMRAMNREQMKKRQPGITEEELARADRLSEDFIRDFPLDDMLNDMIPIYQKHFSKSEIDSLAAFYSSPTGQKFLHEMPAVTAETMQSALPRIQAAVDAALKRAEQERGSTQK